MKLTAALPLLGGLLRLTSAQGLLVNGNSQFPACAATCQLLNQASQACISSPQPWGCFCQSGYLTNLYSSPSGICDAYCTVPADNQQVMTWYRSNCGTDHGASEHAGAAAGGASSSAAAAGSTTAAQASTSGTLEGAVATNTASVGNTAPSNSTGSYTGSWWSAHYKWIIMLLVLLVALSALAALAVYLKRRHDRRADQITTGFNAGITARAPTAPPMSDASHANVDNSMTSTGPYAPGSGRNSPARTREAFMPYGYGYARSESRLAQADADRTGSPLARGSVLAEDDIGAVEEAAGGKGKKRRVLVREQGIGQAR